MYLIQRTNTQTHQPEWVADAALNPTGHSYSRDLRYVLAFSTEEAARRYGVCGNESIVPASSVFAFVVHR